MTKKRSFLIVLLAMVMTLCLGFAVACGDGEEAGGTTYSLKWTVGEHASVAVEGYETLPESVAANTTLTFTVNLDNGYEATVKAGRLNLTAKGGKYTHTVTANTEFTITTNKSVNAVRVTTNPTNLTYYAGDTLDKTGMVVTVDYGTGESVEETAYTINYPTKDTVNFVLGDESFTVSFGGKTSEPVQLAKKVVGLVELDPHGGTIPESYVSALRENTEIADLTTSEKGVVSFTFAKALVEDIALPVVNTVSRGTHEGDFTPVQWNATGAELKNNAIPAETALSVRASLAWNVKLLDITKVHYEQGEEESKPVPYLVVEGTYRAAKSVSLYLYEGNAKVEFVGEEQGGDTVSRGDTFVYRFNMEKFATAKTETGDNYLGKWMDVKFRGETEDGYLETQEILISDVEVDMDETLVVGDYIYSYADYNGALKAVAKIYFENSYTLTVEPNSLVLKLDGKLSKGYAGYAVIIDFTINNTSKTVAVGDDGSYSVEFDFTDLPLGTIGYFHFKVVKSINDTTEVYKDGSDGNLLNEWCLNNKDENQNNDFSKDYGSKAPNDGDFLLKDGTLRFGTEDLTKVFYVGPGKWGGLIIYGYNDRASIEVTDDVELRVDNFAAPTKVYYVVPVQVLGEVGYSTEELNNIVFGNTDGTLMVYEQDVARRQLVSEQDRTYRLWFDVTGHAGKSMLWSNLYMKSVASEGAEPTYTKLLEIKDSDRSTNGLYAVVNGIRYTILCTDAKSVSDDGADKGKDNTYNSSNLVCSPAEEGDTTPEYTDPTFTKPTLTVDYTQCSLTNVEGKPVLTIKGTVKGYQANKITFDVQVEDVWNYIIPKTQETVVSEGKFTLTVDLSDVPANAAKKYLLHIQTNVVFAEDGTYGKNGPTYDRYGVCVDLQLPEELLEGTLPQPVIIGTTKYEIVINEKWEGRYMVMLSVMDAAQPVWTATGADIEKDETHVYVVISGTSQNYDKAALKTELEALNYDFQVNGGDWSRKKAASVAAAVQDDGTWTLKFDVTGLALQGYQMHLGGSNAEAPDNLKIADTQTDGKSVDLNGKTYTLINKYGKDGQDNYYGLVGLRITEVGAKDFQKGEAHLVKEGDKIYITLDGTYANYTKAELEELDWYFDLQEYPPAGGKATGASGGWERLKPQGVLTVDEAAHTWQMKYEITSIAPNHYVLHFSTNGQEGDFAKPGEFKEEQTIGTVQYTLLGYANGTEANYWGNYGVEIVDSGAASVDEVKSVALAGGEKVTFTLTVAVTNFTQEQLLTTYVGNIQNGQVVQLFACTGATVEDGVATLTYDLTEAAVTGELFMNLYDGNTAAAKRLTEIKLGSHPEIAPVTVGSKTFTISWHAEWDSCLLKVEDTAAPTIAYTQASLELDGDKVYYILEATVTKYTQEDLETAVLFDGTCSFTVDKVSEITGGSAISSTST